MSKVFFSPVDSFDILIVNSMFSSCGLDFFLLSNFSLAIIELVILFILVFRWSLKYATILPAENQVLLEQLYDFVYFMVKGYIGTKGLIFFPFIFTLLNFLIFSNVLGLNAFSFSAASHISFTFLFSFSILCGIIIIGIIDNSFNFFKLFLLESRYVVLLPLFLIIEIFSYFLRMFSLAIRLCANIVSGHTLVYIFFWVLIQVATSSLFFYFNFVIFFPIVLVALILILEFCMSLIQAYVFTMLVCLYLGEVVTK